MAPPGSVGQAERWTDSRPSGECSSSGMRASAASSASPDAGRTNVLSSDFSSPHEPRLSLFRRATDLVVRASIAPPKVQNRPSCAVASSRGSTRRGNR